MTINKQEKTLRDEAEKRVLAVRGSYDAPGFDACVEAEIKEMTQEPNTKVTGFESRISELEAIDNGISEDDDYRNNESFWKALDLVRDLQSALAAKDAEIAELRGLLGEVHEDVADTLWCLDNMALEEIGEAMHKKEDDLKEFQAKLTAALAQKGGDNG